MVVVKARWRKAEQNIIIVANFIFYAELEIRVKRPRTPQPSQAVCFICGCESPTTAFWEAMTMELNDMLNECATNLSDEKLLAKLMHNMLIATLRV